MLRTLPQKGHDWQPRARPITICSGPSQAQACQGPCPKRDTIRSSPRAQPNTTCDSPLRAQHTHAYAQHNSMHADGLQSSLGSKRAGGRQHAAARRQSGAQTAPCWTPGRPRPPHGPACYCPPQQPAFTPLLSFEVHYFSPDFSLANDAQDVTLDNMTQGLTLESKNSSNCE
jgi:hypothetical protein